MAKMKFQDNYDLLCWFHKHILAINPGYSSYQAVQRRDGAVAEFPKIEDNRILLKGNKAAVRMKEISTSRERSKE